MKLHKKYKLALITGATSGIGRALAIALADEKVALILTGRNQTKLSQLASYLRSHVDVSFFNTDLGNLNDFEKLKDQIYTNSPDLVINSAGIGIYGDVLTHTTQSQLKILDINCRALTEITLEAARALKSENKKGTILNISSVASFLNYPFFSLYAASKAYVNHLSKSLDSEFKEHGIRVFVTCPGKVSTNFGKNAGRVNPKKSMKLVMSQQEAANEIIYQLKHDIPFHVFNWAYRYLLFLSKFIPKRILEKTLKKEILNRISERPFIPITKQEKALID